MSMTLSSLLHGIAECPDGAGDIVVSGLNSDSRQIKPGDVFAALAGVEADGADYVASAIENGAVAVIAHRDADLPKKLKVPVVTCGNPRHIFALAAARFFGRQPDVMVAVTGTNGKTSVASFVRQIWGVVGLPAASIGTLGIVSPAGTRKLVHTTPDPVELHSALAELAKQQIGHVALEASSHGLAQYRLHGVRFAAAAFTNLTRDHLDYHQTYEAYLDAKMMLFEEVLGEGATAIVNSDMPEAEEVMARCASRGLVVASVGRKGTGLKLVSATPQGFGQLLEVEGRHGSYRVFLPLMGDFQTENALMAVGLVVAAGGSEPHAMRALEQLQGAAGRLELVATTDAGAPIFVDFAHTPDALEHVLRSLRPYASGKLHVVFGAGGDRDPGKRPEMGRVVSEHADVAIVTDDNPRTEKPASIRAAIMAECPMATEIGDRAQAIQHAVDNLSPGDVLVIAGKGHETGQTVGNKVIPFSDQEAVLACVAGRVANG